MNMEDWKKIDNTYVAKTYSRYPVVLEKGKGSIAYDDQGRKYIDLGTGIGVNVFGYGDEQWKKAVTDQLDEITHTSNLYYSEPCAALAEMLCKKTGMKKVFFSNSGAEANECAIKAARKYAAMKKGSDTCNIITLKNSFHGRTLTMLAATGQDMFHQLYTPLTPGFLYAEPEDLDSVRRLLASAKVAGIMIECVQGEGGVNVMSREFVQGLQEIADHDDLVLIVDEVQTGNGRTGSLYSYMQYGIHPDVVTTAKGLGGGLPIGATMLSEKLKDIFAPGDNGSTFGGNPVVAAGACSILSRLDDAFLEEVRKKGEWLKSVLEHAEGVSCYRGLGLMAGIEPAHASADEVVRKCLERGVLVLTAHHNTVRILPALNIPEEELKEAVGILLEVLKEKEEDGE